MSSPRSFFPLVVFLASAGTLLVACSSSTPESSDAGTEADSATPTPTPTGTGTGTLPTLDAAAPDGGPAEARLATIQSSIFTPSCARSGCHSGSRPSAGLSLEAGKSHAQLVGVASTQNPGQTRVVAGDPTTSLLSLCLRARVGAVGRMPDNGAALSASQISTIDAWITAGAKND
jgi:hypothetical protein